MGKEFTFNPESISDAEVCSRIPDDLNKSVLEETNYYLLQLSNLLEKANIEVIANLYNNNNNKQKFLNICSQNLDLKLN